MTEIADVGRVTVKVSIQVALGAVYEQANHTHSVLAYFDRFTRE